MAEEVHQSITGEEESAGERSGHIADRQSKYLPRRNVGIRPLREQGFVSLGKLMAGPQSGHYQPMVGS